MNTKTIQPTHQRLSLNYQCKANQFVETLQERKGILVGSPELSAFQSKLITKETLSILVESMAKSKYGESLKSNL